jgi:hypothetical protein
LAPVIGIDYILSNCMFIYFIKVISDNLTIFMEEMKNLILCFVLSAKMS